MTELNRELLSDKLLDRPIAGLRDVQYTYGVIATAASDASGENAPYLSVGEVESLVGQEDNPVVSIDLTRTDTGVSMDSVSFHGLSEPTQRAVELEYSRYNASSGLDHGPTHMTGKNAEAQKVSKYLKERLTRWTDLDGVQEVEETHPDGELITQLRELGDDDDILDAIDEQVDAEIGDRRMKSLVTLRVREDTHSEYKWPNKIPVFSESMRSAHASRASDKKVFSQPSKGEGTGLVTGQSETLVGAASDPLNHFKTKQQSTFQGLKHDESSWLDHPISGDAATFISKSADLIDDMYVNVFQHRMYMIPYFKGEITPQKSRILYKYAARVREGAFDDLIARPENGDTVPQERLNELSRLHHRGNSVSDMCFYVVLLQYDHNTLYNFTAELPRVETDWIELIATAHATLVNSGWFGEDGVFSNSLPDEADELSWPEVLRQPQDDVRKLVTHILDGGYVTAALPSRENYTESDFRATLHQSLLTGEQLSRDRFLSKCVEEITERYDGEVFPTRTVQIQFIQLMILDTVGFFTQSDSYGYPSESDVKSELSYTSGKKLHTMGEQVETVDTDGDAEDDTVDELASVCEQMPVDGQWSSAAFVLGATTGRVAAYQRYHREVSATQTVLARHPVSRVSSARLREVMTELVDKCSSYAQSNGHIMIYNDYLTEAREMLSAAENGDETPHESELKYAYSLGVTYGTDSNRNSNDTTDTNE